MHSLAMALARSSRRSYTAWIDGLPEQPDRGPLSEPGSPTTLRRTFRPFRQSWRGLRLPRPASPGRSATWRRISSASRRREIRFSGGTWRPPIFGPQVVKVFQTRHVLIKQSVRATLDDALCHHLIDTLSHDTEMQSQRDAAHHRGAMRRGARFYRIRGCSITISARLFYATADQRTSNTLNMGGGAFPPINHGPQRTLIGGQGP